MYFLLIGLLSKARNRFSIKKNNNNKKKAMEGGSRLWYMSCKRSEEPLKFTEAKPRWISKATMDVYKNGIRGISTAAEVIAEATVEMPRMLLSQWEVHQASEAPPRMLDGLRVVIESYLTILCCPSIVFFVRTKISSFWIVLDNCRRTTLK